MSTVQEKAFFSGAVVPVSDALLSITSSAVLYGLSVYTVFRLNVSSGRYRAFRLKDHYQRLVNSSRLLGLADFSEHCSYEMFLSSIRKVVRSNEPSTDQFVRVTYHAISEVPGPKTADVDMDMSVFMYDASPILPDHDASVVVGPWKRVAHDSIPPNAKTNGAYVNSCLAKQFAVDEGYDDCIFLNAQGHVSELSAANVFLVKDGVLVTPDKNSDILLGITRDTILDIADDMGIAVEQRPVMQEELLAADEVFASGTSASLSKITSINRVAIVSKHEDSITDMLKDRYVAILGGSIDDDKSWLTEM